MTQLPKFGGNSAMITWLKIAFINAVIVCGSVAIAIMQWPEAVKNSGFGSNGYNQGMMGTILLALLMAGIPIVVFAVATHLGLTWLLMKSGELEEYKARKALAHTDNARNSATTREAGNPHNSLD
jgi:hypothetical protein